ncbi:hypothetical protein [Oscillatoria sp. FACHB-1406]|uniref:hypothetical protein n=1 Tax=Oscillatoria sp. FACHB-1406 TaxID=2692846 RepID=UPI0016894EAE|nr:hypothetical protein [Oscillatoria sp. FACHB-1406]MBD2580125.1 hypothetical protein [Oscillatoria sp. FACHB-1406]
MPQTQPVSTASPNVQLLQKRQHRQELLRTVAIKVAVLALVAGVTGYCDNLAFNVAIQSLASIVMETCNERAAQRLNDKLARLERSQAN